MWVLGKVPRTVLCPALLVGPRMQRQSMRCRDGSYHTISYTTTCGALQTDVQFGRESSVFVKFMFL